MNGGPLRRAIEGAQEGTGYSLADLTVLSQQNDPYRVDTQAGHRNAAWVLEQFQHIDRPRIHVRGLHYSIVARGGVLKPNGDVYVNDEASWTWLQSTGVKAARWLGYVPFSAIIDERNAPPTIHRLNPGTPDTWIHAGCFSLPGVASFRPTADCDDFAGRQPYQLVIIGEKSSLEDVTLPIASRFQADLYLPTGEISDTLVYQIATDAAADGRPMRLFYLSDFDPAGYEMPANVGRKLQALRDLEFPDLDFECRSIALTIDQVRDLELPSTPLKESELRGDRWRAAWGVEQTEIDALATLRPQELHEIIRAALEPFFDRTLAARVARAQRQWEAEAQSWLDAELDQGLLGDLLRQVGRNLAELSELNEKIEATTDSDFELPEPEIPEPEVDPEAHGKPIVSSDWDWAEATRALIARKKYAEGKP
jgi:hypothetical protein